MPEPSWKRPINGSLRGIALSCSAERMPAEMSDAEIRYDCVSAGRLNADERMMGGVTGKAKMAKKGQFVRFTINGKYKIDALRPANMARACCRPQMKMRSRGILSCKP